MLINKLKLLDILKKQNGTILSVPCAFGKTIVAIDLIKKLKKKKKKQWISKDFQIKKMSEALIA